MERVKRAFAPHTTAPAWDEGVRAGAGARIRVLLALRRLGQEFVLVGVQNDDAREGHGGIVAAECESDLNPP